MTDKRIALAKAISSGVRRAVRESGLEVNLLSVGVIAETDAGKVEMSLNGVPPFVTLEIALEGQDVIRYVGHPATHTE